MARLALCRGIYHWLESVLTLYLAEGGVGIITGRNTAGEHCLYNRQLRKFIAKLSSKLNYLTNYITISGYRHYHMRDHELVNPIDVMT